MFCKSCGKEIPEGTELCDECAAKSTENVVTEGNNNTSSYTTVEPETTVINNNQYNSNNVNPNQNPNAKSKMAAGLFGIFLGGLGVHNFYLGYTGKAVAQLLISLLSCGMLAAISSVWGLIEGILIFTGSINTDANGNPLKD